MKTRFIMHAGLRTIGGVICSVTYGKDRVIFEMGTAYNPSTDVYDGFVHRRVNSRVRDALRMNIIPRIDGIYARDDIEGIEGLVAAEDSDLNTAIFITHLHLDHMGGIGMVAPQIPIYMNENAVIIERALEATGEGAGAGGREFIHFDENAPIRIGAIEVQPILTSNRSYRDFAFLITTPDGTIHWTGDLALHGADAHLAFDQMNFLKSRDIDVLVVDSTSFMDDVLLQINNTADAEAIVGGPEIPAGMLDTSDVDRELFRVLQAKSGLCVFNFYQREMDEVQKYIEWAQRVGRICVFEPDCAYIVYKFWGIEPNMYIPDSERYPEEPEKQPDWFRELLQNCTVIGREQIWENPAGYLLQNSYRHVLELFDLPDAEGSYLHADGIPIGAFDPTYENLMRIIGQTGFEYVTFFCKNYFGHGYPQQVKYFCDEVDAKVLIPCHGFNPERLLPKSGEQLLPEEGRAYILANGELLPE